MALRTIRNIVTATKKLLLFKNWRYYWNSSHPSEPLKSVKWFSLKWGAFYITSCKLEKRKESKTKRAILIILSLDFNLKLYIYTDICKIRLINYFYLFYNTPLEFEVLLKRKKKKDCAVNILIQYLRKIILLFPGWTLNMAKLRRFMLPSILSKVFLLEEREYRSRVAKNVCTI